MTVRFQAAVRRHVPLLIGLTGGAGSGKTYSALRLGKGIAGDRRFCVIDTEAGRASHYADDFAFDVLDLAAPFSPARFMEAVRAAVEAGYPAIVIDSFTMEWTGEGGVLSMQEAEIYRMAGDDYRKQEAVKMAAWIKPKGEHRKLLDGLVQIRTPLIFGFRGKPAMEIKKNPKTGKMEPVEGAFRPTTADDVPYEMTALFILSAARPGCVDFEQPNKISKPIRPLIQDGQEINEEFGAAIAAWARGVEDGNQRSEQKPAATPTPALLEVMGSDGKVRRGPPEQWVSSWLAMLAAAQKEGALDRLRALVEKNAPQFEAGRAQHPEAVREVEEMIGKVLTSEGAAA